MEGLTAAKVIRRVRQRLELSQEGLSRLLNATKGAVQHWERGRNNPDLGRLLALRQICPPSPERKSLDALIRQTQAQVAPLYGDDSGRKRTSGSAKAGGARYAPGYPTEGLTLLRRENGRFKRQITRIHAALQKRTERLHILEGLVTDLQRELAKLRATARSGDSEDSHNSSAAEVSQLPERGG
jgi:transcriptional regulator with XRE-family HTH domain